MKKIEFVEAEFKNFLSYGNNWQKFKFGKGLNIIQGFVVESGKSNGSGKSSLTEVVPFALFGKTIKKVNKNDVINYYNGKACEVRLKFTVDDVPHEIHRGIKPNKLEVYVDGSQLPKPAKVTDFQFQIEEEIIGMDFQTFQNLIYFSPNNTISIINAGKPEKRKFLESLFDLSVYSQMLEVVNRKMKANEEALLESRIRIESLEKENERLEKEITNTNMPNTRAEEIKLKGLGMQLEERQAKEFDVTEKELQQAKDALKTAIESHTQWEKTLKDAESLRTLHESMLARMDNIEEIKKKNDEISNNIADLEKEIGEFNLEEEEAVLVDRNQHKELMKDNLKAIIECIQVLETKIAVANSELAQVLTDMSKLEKAAKSDKKEGICDACGNIIDGDILTNMRNEQQHELDNKHAEIVDKINELEAERDNKAKEKEQRFEEVKAESDSIKELRERCDSVKTALQTIKALRERQADLPDTDALEESVREHEAIIKAQTDIRLEAVGKIHMIELDIESLEKEEKTLFERMEAKKENDWEIKKLIDLIEEAKDYLRKMDELAQKIHLEIEEKNHTVYSNTEEITERRAMVEKGNRMTDYLNYIKTSLKDENVKRFAISALIPYLNQQANMYLAESGFPYVVTVDSWLDVIIKGLGVDEVAYGNLSGGESKCIDMAVQLACNDIASMMAKASLNLMILDEVLDSSVDSLGVQALLNIIRVRQRNLNGSVYVITHRNEIDEFTFDSIVRIMNEDKFSRIEVA